jgi:FMN reductase
MLSAVGISGSTSATSRSRRLVACALLHLRAYGAHTSFIDLAALPAEALLARESDPSVDDALVRTAAARILVIGTPIYRATYSGQLKCFFDLLPRDALAGSVAGLIATGYAEGHRLAIDHGLRPLVASLGGLTAARAIYATDAQLSDAGEVPAPIEELADGLAAELWCVASARVVDGPKRPSPPPKRNDQ